MRAMPLLAGCTALLVLGLPSSRYAAAAPDNTPGMAMLSAVVTSGGGLRGGSGATLADRAAMGIYQVHFERAVAADCYYVPTLSSRTFSFAAGSASVAPNNSGNNKLTIFVFDTNGALADFAFHLLVYCNR